MGDDFASNVMTIPSQCESVDKISNTLAQFIIFDRDVFFEFFQNDERLRLLYESVYIPVLTSYYNSYAQSLNEIEKKNSKIWKTRALLVHTWRGKGIKIFSDYMRSIHQLYEVFSFSVQIKDTPDEEGIA